MALTAAERQARRRMRLKAEAEARSEQEQAALDAEKEAKTLPERFLRGIITDAETAAATGRAQPWMMARAATAVDLLATITAAEAAASGLNPVIAVAHGAVTEEERGALLKFHEKQFDRWLATSSSVPESVRLTMPQAIEHARMTLMWAEKERKAGRSTSASTTQGINAVKRLQNKREKAVRDAYDDYTKIIVAESLLSLTAGRSAPYDAPEPPVNGSGADFPPELDSEATHA